MCKPNKIELHYLEFCAIMADFYWLCETDARWSSAQPPRLMLQNVLNKSEPAEWVYTGSVLYGMWPQSFGSDRKSPKAKFCVLLNHSPGKYENHFCSIVPGSAMLNGLQMGHMWSL